MNALSNAEVEDVFPAKSQYTEAWMDEADLVTQRPARPRESGVGLGGHESVPDTVPHGVGAGFAGGQSLGLNRNILALDLATRCGWAIRKRDGVIIGGTESFVPKASWDAGQRGLRFRAWLIALVDRYQINAITYEQVVRRPPTTQAATAHMYGLFEGLLWMVASTRQIVVTGVGISTIKKEWTGNGAADKPMMVAEAKRRGFRPVDDNHADAIAILDWAVARELGRPLKYPPLPKAEKKKAFAERGVKRAKEQRKAKAAAAPQGALL